eukprot:Hpha_TRINITY_DN15735_c2_g3::TRINITY_DN15735_c2_g3_i1::g.41951::m.41951
MRLLHCPYGCGASLRRQDLEEHMRRCGFGLCSSDEEDIRDLSTPPPPSEGPEEKTRSEGKMMRKKKNVTDTDVCALTVATMAAKVAACATPCRVRQKIGRYRTEDEAMRAVRKGDGHWHQWGKSERMVFACDRGRCRMRRRIWREGPDGSDGSDADRSDADGSESGWVVYEWGGWHTCKRAGEVHEGKVFRQSQGKDSMFAVLCKAVIKELLGRKDKNGKNKCTVQNISETLSERHPDLDFTEIAVKGQLQRYKSAVRAEEPEDEGVDDLEDVIRSVTFDGLETHADKDAIVAALEKLTPRQPIAVVPPKVAVGTGKSSTIVGVTSKALLRNGGQGQVWHVDHRDNGIDGFHMLNLTEDGN